MSRSVRKSYPSKLNFILRLSASRIQRESHISASLVHKLRKGQVKHLSESTVFKLSKLYDNYWVARAKKSGAREDETRSWLEAGRTPNYIKRKMTRIMKIALKIQQARCNRDKHLPKYKPSWHKLHGYGGIIDQMTRDTKRSIDRWMVYVKHNTFLSRQDNSQHYTKARLLQHEADNLKYQRKHRREKKIRLQEQFDLLQEQNRILKMKLKRLKIRK